jgi:uncharacterized protein YcfL
MKIKFLFLAALILVACNDKPDIFPADTQLTVFPNPARYDVNIRFQNPDNSAYTVVVFDTRGDIIFEKNESAAEPAYRVDLADEPVGTYHVVLKKDNETITRQFIKSND